MKFRFYVGQIVVHRKSGHRYTVIGVPEEGWTIEKTMEPAYIYTRSNGEDPRKWLRPQSEMEDGRFFVP